MSLITLAGFSVVGFVFIRYIIGENVAEVILRGESFAWQALIGTCYGVYTAIFMSAVISLTPLKEISQYYIRLFEGLNLNFADIAFYSLCAGIGEEILFRGGIQLGTEYLLSPYFSTPHLAIWIIALGFVALHMYFDFSDWRMMLNASLLVIISAGFGYLFYYIGLVSAIFAHFIFDLIIFSYLIYNENQAKSKKQREEGW